MKRPGPWFSASALCVIASACADPEPALRPGCHPLGGGEVGLESACLLPFPSSFYTQADAKSATGLRVALPQELLPRSESGIPLEAEPLNRRDGASAVTAILAHLPGPPIDPAQLPGPTRIAESLRADSRAQLLEFPSGARVPIFAEPDQNAESGGRQLLVLQPQRRLRPGTRHVVALQRLRHSDGTQVAALAGFAALRDGRVADGSPRQMLRRTQEEILAFLAQQGLAREDLQLAWDFTTGSDEQTVGEMVRMRDAVLAALAQAPAPPVTITTVRRAPAADVALQLVGNFRAPTYLLAPQGAGLQRDGDGRPTLNGFASFPLFVQVPACALKAAAPVPALLFGHGTFGTAEAELSTDFQMALGARLCMIQVGTDLLGRAQSDVTHFVSKVMLDFSQLRVETERLQQAHMNLLVLAHLLRTGVLAALPELAQNGRPLLAAGKPFYLGISEGGCQGPTFLALTADVDRAVLNVPCGFWSQFFWRSSDMHSWLPLLSQQYSDAVDRQLLLALAQANWDPTEPAHYAPHVLRDALPGGTAKQVLYQEGINDASVPNLTTRAMARTLGLPLLQPAVESVWGIEERGAPLDSAYVQFAADAVPAERLGLTNVPPPPSPIHESIRRLPAVQDQLQRFLREGGAASLRGGTVVHEHK